MTELAPPYRPIRVAILGTGYIAEFHARAIKAAAEAELVAVCDTNLNAAKAFAATWDVPATYNSLELMLSEHRIDCVHVLVPPDLHFQMTKISLQGGAHVFLEKPMCLTTKEADELLALAMEKQRHLAVNHNMM